MISNKTVLRDATKFDHRLTCSLPTLLGSNREGEKRDSHQERKHPGKGPSHPQTTPGPSPHVRVCMGSGSNGGHGALHQALHTAFRAATDGPRGASPAVYALVWCCASPESATISGLALANKKGTRPDRTAHLGKILRRGRNPGRVRAKPPSKRSHFPAPLQALPALRRHRYLPVKTVLLLQLRLSAQGRPGILNKIGFDFCVRQIYGSLLLH